ncbi:DNA-binding MarR family transcriptional regulator [Thermocatellispora tengchongensis]|uniref:DNA-binding MarR family transcriptional regulator n=1 Tax=Thermocatellispora tengchongensis TaxID=1073253 RepID=A0A840PLG9_9ACTN|nr:helix-turn-helix domain-containing protein [Thermocatellispora tengchongensis]MBB5139932.1 DNA-binding MarR family transcriptional regulator [Thermocatellispora tengchongensis]
MASHESRAPEPYVLDDPARLKALAHPMRRRMLRHLSLHGPATSTTLGELLGAKTGTTSYHLRQLEKYGFIEEIPERSAGRERWWRASPERRDLRLPDPDQLPPEDRAALLELHRVNLAEDLELLSHGLPAAYGRDPAWVKASRGLVRMTEAEFAEFFEAYMALLMRYSRSAEDAPPGSRPVYARLYAFPAEG